MCGALVIDTAAMLGHLSQHGSSFVTQVTDKAVGFTRQAERGCVGCCVAVMGESTV